MSCDITMVTPEKTCMEEIFLIEDIEKKLMSFSHLLERSTEKEKSHLYRISEQAAAISSLQGENENLKEENEKLMFTLQEYMKNFVCFTDNLKRTNAVEEENLRLKLRIEESQNETNDRIVDLEIEKDKLKKDNTKLTEENEKLKEEVKGLKDSLEKLNNLIMDTFKQTLAFTKEEKIKTLEKTLTKRDHEISELKNEIEKTKENYEKALKQKSMEYELLKIDYQSAIVQNIKGRQNDYKSEKTERTKNQKNTNRIEKSDISERSASKNRSNNKIFQITTTKSPLYGTEERPVRKTRGNGNYKNIIKSLQDDIDVEEEEFYYKDDDFYENEFDEQEESLIDDDDFEEEVYPIKKGKRKVRESKKKPQTKKVKKNENKELLMVNRNTINYHLFN